MAFTVASHLGCKALRTAPCSSFANRRPICASLHARQLKVATKARIPSTDCTARRAVKARSSPLQVVNGKVYSDVASSQGAWNATKMSESILWKANFSVECSRFRKYRKSSLRRSWLSDKFRWLLTFMQHGAGRVYCLQRSWSRYCTCSDCNCTLYWQSIQPDYKCLNWQTV